MNDLNVVVKNGVNLFSSRLIAEATGKEHSNVVRDIKNMLESLGLYDFHPSNLKDDDFKGFFINYKDYQGRKVVDEILLDKQLTMCLVTGYDAKQRMRVIKRVDELEERIKQLAAPQRQPALPAPVETTLALVEATARMLNLCDSSKLQMLQQVFKEYNVPVGILPKYTTDGDASARLTKSLKDILKDNNVGISAQKANTYLVEEGILEVKSRQSSKGVKKFKALTELGLKFGKNEISPHNPREVQPHYFEDMAEELIKIIKSKHAIKQLTEVENE